MVSDGPPSGGRNGTLSVWAEIVGLFLDFPKRRVLPKAVRGIGHPTQFMMKTTGKSELTQNSHGISGIQSLVIYRCDCYQSVPFPLTQCVLPKLCHSRGEHGKSVPS